MCPMETRRTATLAETWRHGALGAAVVRGTLEYQNIYTKSAMQAHNIIIQRQQRDLNSVLIIDSVPPAEHRTVCCILFSGGSHN